MAIYIELYTIYFLFLRFRMLSYCIVKLTVFFVILLSIIFFSPSSSTHLCLSLLFDFYSLFFSVFEHCLCFFFFVQSVVLWFVLFFDFYFVIFLFFTPISFLLSFSYLFNFVFAFFLLFFFKNFFIQIFE